MTKGKEFIKIFSQGLYKRKEDNLKLYNEFEPVIKLYYPVIDKIKEALRVLGADSTGMTGKGPTVFAIEYSKTKALNICKEISKSINLNLACVVSSQKTTKG